MPSPQIAHGKAPLGIVKKTEQDFYDYLATEPGFIDTFFSYNDVRLKLENYQLAFVSDESPLRCVEKSRQTGYSFVFAIEAVARGHLRETHNSIFVSYNLADAKEKIAYCKQLHEEMPLEFQKKLVTDSKLELAFESNSSSGKRSRITSHPSKAPRGRHGDIYLDELAHCQNDKEIYRGSTALILRSGGQLTVCSSPLGRRGVFWEIAREELRPYKGFTRQRIPWWLCSDFSLDVFKSAIEAPNLTTHQRLEKYGKQKIVTQFENMTLEDFQQEFEVFYSDEAMVFFPYELILPCCTVEDEDMCSDFGELSNARGRLTAGYDVGRKRDASELSVFEEINGRQRCRMLKSYDRVPFETQQHELRALLTIAPMGRLSIDQTGMGIQMAETLSSEFPGVVVPEMFTNSSKEIWCNDFKIGLQQRAIELPRDRSLIAQIHSIQRSVTTSSRLTFEAKDSTEKGHADKFWSCALATRKERVLPRLPVSIGVRVIG